MQLVSLTHFLYDFWRKIIGTIYFIKSTFTWEAKWTHTGLRFQTGVKTSSVHMKFHFGCISKRPYILMDMRRHFISGSVYMIFYHPKWNFISVKMTDMKSIPAMSFKHTCALNVIFNESALIHFVSGKFCSHENLMPVNIHVNTSKELTEYRSEIFNRNEISYRSEFISPLMWTYSNSTNFIAWLPLLLEILGNMWCIARFGTICTI